MLFFWTDHAMIETTQIKLITDAMELISTFGDFMLTQVIVLFLHYFVQRDSYC